MSQIRISNPMLQRRQPMQTSPKKAMFIHQTHNKPANQQIHMSFVASPNH